MKGVGLCTTGLRPNPSSPKQSRALTLHIPPERYVSPQPLPSHDATVTANASSFIAKARFPGHPCRGGLCESSQL